MPELTDNQIADLRALQHRCAALGAELVIIGAIAYQIHFPAESRHTGDIDFAVALDLDEFAELNADFLQTAGSVSQTVSTDGGAPRQRSWT